MSKPEIRLLYEALEILKNPPQNRKQKAMSKAMGLLSQFLTQHEDCQQSLLDPNWEQIVDAVARTA